MFTDLEIPFMVLFLGTQVPNRMVLHSLLGSVTIGTFLAVILTVRFYPFIVNRLFHVDEEKVESKYKFSFTLVFSVLIGNLSHVLLDVTNHPHNPFFWPFRSAIATPSPSISLLGTPWGRCGCK
jgi:membrane-bound metal-dependent hydrolase YbcI (DUF457 family)